MLLDAPGALLGDGVPADDLATLLAGAPCDVALVAGPSVPAPPATRP